MPYLVITGKKSWTHGDRRYGPGQHEVSESVAEAARRAARAHRIKGIAVRRDHDKMIKSPSPNAEVGPLTTEKIAKPAEEPQAPKPVKKAEPAPAVAAPAEVHACDHDDCDKTFPTAAALKRHVTVNHKPEQPETPASAPETPASAPEAETPAEAQPEAQTQE